MKIAKELKPTFERDVSYAFLSVGGNIITKIPQGELTQAYYKFAKSKDGSKGIGKGEQVLDKVKTYEQARNKVLDLV